MKKVFLFGLTGLFLLGLSSCNKECVCKVKEDGKVVEKYSFERDDDEKCSDENESDGDYKVVCR